MRGESEERRWLRGPGSSRTVTGAARREERAAAARVCVPDRRRQLPWSRAQEGEEGQLRARAFLPGPGAGFPVRPVQGGEQAGGHETHAAVEGPRCGGPCSQARGLDVPRPLCAAWSTTDTTGAQETPEEPSHPPGRSWRRAGLVMGQKTRLEA